MSSIGFWVENTGSLNLYASQVAQDDSLVGEALTVGVPQASVGALVDVPDADFCVNVGPEEL